MRAVFSEAYKNQQSIVEDFVNNFSDEQGELFGKGDRNKIKLFPLDGKLINIKSFKVPNAVNKIAYRFLRKSKAERSFNYAQYLISKNIGTPYPIAFAENKTTFFFLESYYVSEHLECNLTYRELVTQPNYPDHENILRAFTRFTFELHQKRIEFLDHSPGNTLIKKDITGAYEFFLVDLNRMNFRDLNFLDRMKNFARLTPKIEMVQIMADEYSKLIKEDKDIVFETMWRYTQEFQNKFKRKKELKKKLKFWKA
ncbi:lipopolysaccharide kinase InaA family protein [Gillisia marina]|uniref:lipopolysaccharide kinase InaA family protein n=1 Tax=Gillisia marina TaxID=1167637 RepID=UPI00029A487D|nr:lipopolysaccharide kinase InaA family protein [Gillisia marina]